MNPSIEAELVEFKQEIEEKFGKSKVNQEYQFPRKHNPKTPGPKFSKPTHRHKESFGNSKLDT